MDLSAIKALQASPVKEPPIVTIEDTEENKEDPTNDVTEEITKPKKKKTKKKKVDDEAQNWVMTRARFTQYQEQNKGMRPQRVGVVYDDMMLMHRCHDKHHPERPERLMAVYLNLLKKDLYSRLKEIHSEQAE